VVKPTSGLYELLDGWLPDTGWAEYGLSPPSYLLVEATSTALAPVA
jgi:hypothetical protein